MTLKDMEGKNIYLIPTGNNINRGRESGKKIIKAKLIKVARVFATFEINNLGVEKYRYKDNILKNDWNDWNGGYGVYQSEQDALDHLKSIRLFNKMIAKILGIKQ